MMLGSQQKSIPVKEVVGGFYLRRVSYEKTDKFESAKFSFIRDGTWINLYVSNPEKVDDADLMQKRRYRAALKIESVASLFLDEEVMRECFREAKSFKSFVQSIAAEIERTQFRNVELEAKILPGPKMGITIPFLRKSGDKKRQLAYSDYELQIIRNPTK